MLRVFSCSRNFFFQFWCRQKVDFTSSHSKAVRWPQEEEEDEEERKEEEEEEEEKEEEEAEHVCACERENTTAANFMCVCV